MRLFILCGFGWSADVGEIRLIGFLLDGHTLEFELTAGERWVLSAVLFLGMFIGAWFWGLVADRFGRKHAFTATCALTFTFGAGSALSDSAAALAACRFGAPGPLAPCFPTTLSSGAFAPRNSQGRGGCSRLVRRASRVTGGKNATSRAASSARSRGRWPGREPGG